MCGAGSSAGHGRHEVSSCSCVVIDGVDGMSSPYQLRREGGGVIGCKVFETPRRPTENCGDVTGHVVTVALCHQRDGVGIVLGHVLRKSDVEHRLLLLSDRDRMEGDGSAEHA